MHSGKIWDGSIMMSKLKKYMIFTVMVQATNVKSIQELRDLKTYKEKLSFDFEIEFEFVIKKN